MQRVDSLTRDKLGPLLRESKSVTGKIVTSLSVFALGTIPALLNLGYHIGDIINVDIYQKNRNDKWIWDLETSESFVEDYFKIKPPSSYQDELVVNVSLSGKISEEAIKKALGKEVSQYLITIDNPSFDFLKTKSQLEQFERIWNLFLTETREQEIDRIHLFCAIPCAIAVLIGKTIHRKLDPEIFIYDLDSSGNQYTLKWKINAE